MAAVSIRDLDDRVKERLRVRAAEHGRSMEAEIRAILTHAVSDSSQGVGMGQALLSRFAVIGGVEVELTTRADEPRAARVTP